MFVSNGKKIPCICVTNRKLCGGDFYEKINQIAKEGVADTILLREKDLSEKEYAKMAERVLALCDANEVTCVMHSFWKPAKDLGCRNIHLPVEILAKLPEGERGFFDSIGSSVHSVEQAKDAVNLGATYVIAGHVYETDCKKGLPGRGLEFVQKIAQEVEVPIYGIGGIHKENAASVCDAGATGICIMSGFFRE